MDVKEMRFKNSRGFYTVKLGVVGNLHIRTLNYES